MMVHETFQNCIEACVAWAARVSTAAMLASRNPKWPTVSGRAWHCAESLDLFRLHEPRFVAGSRRSGWSAC